MRMFGLALRILGALVFAAFTAGVSAQGDKLTLGVFPGVESGAESFEILDRYLPLAQYLSAKLGTQVLLVPVKVPGVAMQRMIEGGTSYKLFFGPPVFASEAIKKAGFVPIVTEQERIRAVFVVKSGSKVQSLKDFTPGTRVGMPAPNLLLTILARESLARQNVELPASARQHMSSAEGIVLALDNDMVDVAVMRDRTAKKLIADKPDRYRVVGESVDAPGFALIAHKSVSDSTRNKLRQVALALNNDSSGLAADVRSGLRTSPFTASRDDDFLALQRMMETWSAGK